jgi:hypothetical protein
VVQLIGTDHLEVEGYGAAGASGSPIFNASGQVVGIVFGGRQTAAGHTVLAVPVREATSLLATLN